MHVSIIRWFNAQNCWSQIAEDNTKANSIQTLLRLNWAFGELARCFGCCTRFITYVYVCIQTCSLCHIYVRVCIIANLRHIMAKWITMSTFIMETITLSDMQQLLTVPTRIQYQNKVYVVNRILVNVYCVDSGSCICYVWRTRPREKLSVYKANVTRSET